MGLSRRLLRVILVTTIFTTLYLMLSQAYHPPSDSSRPDWRPTPSTSSTSTSTFDWNQRHEIHPPASTPSILPSGPPPLPRPRIQHLFTPDQLTHAHNATQRARRDAVRAVAEQSWRAYRAHAFGRDELAPLTLEGRDVAALCGWGATLVDALDTLWIMGLRDEFVDTVAKVASIDWDQPTTTTAAAAGRKCSLFETNIRFLGGLLAAYDLSGEKVLLRKAVDLGDVLYAAFDTPGRMPVNGLDVTGEGKYFAAVDRVAMAMERAQERTRLPGLWPTTMDMRDGMTREQKGTTFSLGAGVDSAVEYLSKIHLLLGGWDGKYEGMHIKAVEAALRRLIFRPMLPPPEDGGAAPDILFSGTVHVTGGKDEEPEHRDVMVIPEVQHLGYFAGGMFALGGKLFNRPDDVSTGQRLARGCAWAYGAFESGVMSEAALVVPCDKETEERRVGRRRRVPRGEDERDETETTPLPEDDDADNDDGDDHVTTTTTTTTTTDDDDDDNNHKTPFPHCPWNETLYASFLRQTTPLPPPPPPFTVVTDPRYLLRPEAIESLFILYRITGHAELLDLAWQMFEAVEAAARTDKGTYASVRDVRWQLSGEGGSGPRWVDSMEVSLLLS
ncbi:hypothetical protein VTJ04DRAFT_3237 [Mycothermus thermophilus]|uniref:uncharacterized protein n=1 Tax=Humicola insolens TaxID=85995 RepID=UPI00374300FA